MSKDEYNAWVQTALGVAATLFVPGSAPIVAAGAAASSETVTIKTPYGDVTCRKDLQQPVGQFVGKLSNAARRAAPGRKLLRRGSRHRTHR